MKETSTCPKCSSRRQWIVEPFRVPNDTVKGAELRLVNDLPTPGDGWLRSISPRGRLDLYICADCGYSEFWARDFDQLRHTPEVGVTLRDHSDPDQGPFR